MQVRLDDETVKLINDFQKAMREKYPHIGYDASVSSVAKMAIRTHLTAQLKKIKK